MTLSVLVVARDAGAADALAPVVRTLVDDDATRVQTVAHGKALPVFEAAALPVLAFPEEPGEEAIENVLRARRVTVVLTGTSMRVDLDGRFWRAAAAVGIPSVALLDHWTNYAERFTVAAPFDTLPTVVAVMDEVAAAELVARGCPADRLRVTGHPRFDDLPAITPQARERARRELNVDPARVVAAFASEPQARHYGDRLGYDELDALAMFLDALSCVAPDAIAIVKLHPLEAAERVLAVTAGRSTPETRVLRAYPARALAAAADVFCGMTSIVLLDAAMLGLPTLSIRPGGGPSHFLDVHADLIESVVSAAGLQEALASALRRSPAPPPSRPRGGASEAVSALLAAAVAGGTRQ